MAKFVELLLSALQFQAEGLLEMTDILFSTPAQLRRRLHRLPEYDRRWFKTNWAEMYRNRQQFYRTLHYLKRQELVAKKETGSNARWALTQRGRERMQHYKKSRLNPFSASSIVFTQAAGDGVTIVAFDIPEKERRKHDWVRTCLVAMGFKKLQKSVWMAKGTVDEDFVHALRDRNLLQHVHIFAVTKRGTMHQATET